MVSPLRLAAMGKAVLCGDINKVRVLLKAGVPASAGDIYPFVSVAAMHRDEEIFDLLIAHGASIETPGLLAFSVDGGGGRHEPSVSIVRKVLLGTQPCKETLNECLRFACVSGSSDVVRMLLERGADPNTRDAEYRFFALANAAQYGHLEIVRELLNHGADTTMEVWEFRENALTGNTSSLVDVAIQNGYPEIAKLLG